MDTTFGELLTRLDLLSSQFQELRDGVRQAIVIADQDPEMSLTRARKVLEYVVRRVYERQVHEPAGSRPLENLLQRIIKDGHIPRRLAAYANSVRELGNVGTHAYGEKVDRSDVLLALSQLMPILEWYFEQEAPAASAPPAPDPVPPAPRPEVRQAAPEVVGPNVAEIASPDAPPDSPRPAGPPAPTAAADFEQESPAVTEPPAPDPVSPSPRPEDRQVIPEAVVSDVTEMTPWDAVLAEAILEPPAAPAAAAGPDRPSTAARDVPAARRTTPGAASDLPGARGGVGPGRRRRGRGRDRRPQR